MDNHRTDAFLAGQLIQWGLQVDAIPFNEPDYMALIDRYIDQQSFRSMVKDVAAGLGLEVVRVNDRGIFLATTEDSVFAMKPSEFRTGVSGDDRLLDGLIEVAIAATVYPRQRDLDEDSFEAKPPISVSEVDETLRDLATAVKSRTNEVDLAEDQLEQGIQEAWRVYDSRPAVKKTSSGQLSKDSTHGLIYKHLQLLVTHGCFKQVGGKGSKSFRPTLRYQLLVRDLAATELYRRFHAIADSTIGELSRSRHA